MSAITSVCGWPRFRWPPILPVHIHLTIESGGRKPSGECFRFPFFGEQSRTSCPGEGASSGLQDTLYTAQISFLGGVSPQYEEQGWKKQKSRAEGGYTKKKGRRKGSLYRNSLPVCYSFPSASSALTLHTTKVAGFFIPRLASRPFHGRHGNTVLSASRPPMEQAPKALIILFGRAPPYSLIHVYARLQACGALHSVC